MGNSINVCDRRNHCAVCFFSSKGSVGATTHSPFIHGGLQSIFLPIDARLGMADGANFYRDLG